MLPLKKVCNKSTIFVTLQIHFYFSSIFNSFQFCIPRCSPDDAGEYKVVAKSPLGEAMTFGTLVVNCE